jgi:hypothetical protein
MRIALLLLLASFGIPLVGHAFVVDVTTDGVDTMPGDGICATSGGHCTVRAAVMESNALAGRQTVTVAAGVHTLAILGRGENASVTGDLDVTDDLDIEGAGAAVTELDAQGFDRVLELRGDASLSLADLTIRNGFTIEAEGAGVRSGSVGLLIASRVTFEGNDASGDGSYAIGGGLSSDLGGTLIVFDSEFRGNAARRGGAIWANGQSVVLDSTLTQNVAARGSALQSYGPTTIERCTISDNEATLNETVGFVGADARLINVTVSGNQDPSALLSTNALLQLTNVTVYDNVAYAALSVFTGGEARIANSVFVNPLATVECDTTPTSRGGNVDRDGSCAVAGSDATVADPLLGPLADNGGPTRTHLPVAGSPLIDAGENDFCPTVDQRLIGRPTDGNGTGSATCDVGAVEVPEPTAFALSLVASASLAGCMVLRSRGDREGTSRRERATCGVPRSRRALPAR